MLDFVNQQKRKGLSTYDALVESVKLRTRPIVMTSVTAILGMVPIAIGMGEGAEMQQPMAIAVIGGLISSTVLTLVFIPVMYSLFDKETRSRRTPYVVVNDYDESGEERRMYLPAHEAGRPSAYKSTQAEDIEEVDDEEAPADPEPRDAEDRHEEMREEQNEEYQEEEKQENNTSADRETNDLSKDELLDLLESIVKRNKNDNEK
ncbi:RND multidrug efflux transporter [Geomicrobium sp. JCM 19039]|nr:RND multidrug efflux transporter [Geomicrobium sp. JCM 19039]